MSEWRDRSSELGFGRDRVCGCGGVGGPAGEPSSKEAGTVVQGGGTTSPWFRGVSDAVD